MPVPGIIMPEVIPGTARIAIAAFSAKLQLLKAKLRFLEIQCVVYVYGILLPKRPDAFGSDDQMSQSFQWELLLCFRNISCAP